MDMLIKVWELNEPYVAHQDVVAVGGTLTNIVRKLTKAGHAWITAELWDPTGVVDVLALPEAYGQYGGQLAEDEPVLLTGKVDKRDDQPRLQITSVRPIPRLQYGQVTVIADVLQERARQDTQWGEQNHPDGTGHEADQANADQFRRVTELAVAEGRLTWRHVLREEVYEAFAETHPARLRTELVQVAAVAQAWIEAIDRRQAGDVRQVSDGAEHLPAHRERPGRDAVRPADLGMGSGTGWVGDAPAADGSGAEQGRSGSGGPDAASTSTTAARAVAGLAVRSGQGQAETAAYASAAGGAGSREHGAANLPKLRTGCRLRPAGPVGPDVHRLLGMESGNE
jgi:hypothetical protein